MKLIHKTGRRFSGAPVSEPTRSLKERPKSSVEMGRGLRDGREDETRVDVVVVLGGVVALSRTSGATDAVALSVWRYGAARFKDLVEGANVWVNKRRIR